jgi:Holliday junction resolvase
MEGCAENSELVQTVPDHVSTRGSTLLNCTIKHSDLENLRMHECEVKGNIRFAGNCEMTISPLALRKFSPENRKNIFEYAAK